MAGARATWRHPKRARLQAGEWEYNRSGGYFVIRLDSEDPVTGQRRVFTTYNDTPDWGEWKRLKPSSPHPRRPPMVSEELKACPWCQLEYQGHYQLAGGAWARYTVPKRHAEGCPLRGDTYASEAELTAAWNTRAALTPPQANDEAVEAVEQHLLRAIEKGKARSDWCVGSVEWRRETALSLLAAIEAMQLQSGGDTEFELIVDDVRVAGACGLRDRALAEILHYAAVYGQDGPVEAFEVIRIPVPIPSAPTKESE